MGHAQYEKKVQQIFLKLLRQIGGMAMLNENLQSLRKAKGLSQEELAIKLNVVRQTVSKWERGLSVPDAEMLIHIAEALDTTVNTLLGEAIPTEQASELKAIASKLEVVNEQLSRQQIKYKKYLRKSRGRLLVILTVSLILISVLLIKTMPVSWDAGACAGGYGTAVFDMYSEELTQRYYETLEDKENISDIKPIRDDTRYVSWIDRYIYMEFDIEYEHSDKGKVREKISVRGKRTWFETYDWNTPTLSERYSKFF